MGNSSSSNKSGSHHGHKHTSEPEKKKVDTVPVVVEKEDKPVVPEIIEQPKVAEEPVIVVAPKVEEAVETPKAEEAVETPKAEEAVETPKAEEAVETPKAEEAVETPKAKESKSIEEIKPEVIAVEESNVEEPIEEPAKAADLEPQEPEVTEEAPAQEASIEALTQSLEKVTIEEPEAEPSEFSIAGKGLKLDTAENVAEIVQEIGEKRNLQKVSFVGNTLGVEASKALATALEAHDNLKVVDLSDCFTGRMKEEVPVSVAAFGAVLVKKQHLESVNFSDNAFGPIGAKALVELLSGSACLQDLLLSNNGLGPEGGRIVAEALTESAKIRTRPLRKVLIGRNRLENGSSPAFAKMLETHSTIEEFALPQCGIRPEGIVTLSAGLAKCTQLKSVDLQDNTFTTSGAEAFAAALPNWKQLESLNVGDCMCEAAGSIAFMKALSESEFASTLKYFNFQYNEMNEEGAKILADNLSKFTALQTLMLNGNSFNPECSAAMAIKSAVSADILDEWDEMDFDEDDEESNADSGFITEKERQELVVEAESEEEAQ